jgi:hypothetical protein
MIDSADHFAPVMGIGRIIQKMQKIAEQLRISYEE